MLTNSQALTKLAEIEGMDEMDMLEKATFVYWTYKENALPGGLFQPSNLTVTF